VPPPERVALEVGAAWAGVGESAGEVVAVFSRAAYLRFGDDLLALVDRRCDPGPLHARVPTLPPVAVGEPVEVSGGLLVCGTARVRVDLTPWAPPPLSPVAATAGAALLAELVTHEPLLGLSPSHALSWESVRQLLDRGPLGEAVAACVGRGRGLTPTGDDVAAGLLLAHAITGATPPDELLALARDARTHAISRAFLVWAARGQSIQSLHALLAAAAAADREAARAALRRLSGVGQTSGMDMAAGVAAAISALARRDDSMVHTHTLR